MTDVRSGDFRSLGADRMRRLVFVWSMVLVLQDKYIFGGESP